jgi:hypothetical protein
MPTVALSEVLLQGVTNAGFWWLFRAGWAPACRTIGRNTHQINQQGLWMMRGDFANLSERKRMECLNRLGYDIEITVRPAAWQIMRRLSWPCGECRP